MLGGDRSRKYYLKERPTQMSFLIRTLCFLIVLVTFAWQGAERLMSAESISFNQQVRPLLSDRCYACHGPDQESRAAGLRLDDRKSALEAGVLDLTEDNENSILDRVLSEDPEYRMPPPEHSEKLNGEEVNLLRQWVQAGAPYENHWAFEPIPSSEEVLGEVADFKANWAEDNLDRLVESQSHARGLVHSDAVDREVWLRRVTFDLTGLPPTLDERENFLSDSSDTCYDKVVTRLLGSPAYGERMAAHWLDVARYADTFGYQNDMEMQVWPWRDWVIRAFNENMPYDQFIIEQLAGDLIPGASQDQKLATAFNRLHRQTNEGGSVAEEFRLAGIADRTTTTGTAFLGLTLECCRCHDHKFDPLTQEEFYQLSAYFSDIDEFGLYAHFTRAAPTPSMPIYGQGQLEEHRRLAEKIVEAERRHDQQWAKTADFTKEVLNALVNQDLDLAPDFTDALEGGVPGVIGEAREFNGDDELKFKEAPEFGRESRYSYSFWMRLPESDKRMIVFHQSRAADDSGFRGIQFVVDNGKLEFSKIHFWPGNAVRVRTESRVAAGVWTHVVVTHDGSGDAKGIELFVNGVRQPLDTVRDKLSLDVRHRREWGDSDVGNVKLTLGARFRDVGFTGGQLDELKVYQRALTAFEIKKLFNATSEQTVEISQEDLRRHLIKGSQTMVELREELDQLRKLENDFATNLRRIMVMERDEDAGPTFILERGEYAQKTKEVESGVPGMLAHQIPDGEDRLSLAKWIASGDNPLTARVMANRIWYLLFGRGLVRTLEDFGAQGSPPTHPLLLDYLAAGLVENDWNLHWLIREIVLSKTYQQSSDFTGDEGDLTDPDNLWLTRGPRHRLSAEQIRDLVLASSGLLVRKIGGPSVKPYQPDGLWREAGTGKTYQTSKGEGLYRRSLYTFWRRTSPPPSMLTLDATSRESCTPRRESTTTPLQALVFLNDTQYVEAARELALSLLKSSAQPGTERWERLFQTLLSRNPSELELAIVNQAYQDQKALFLEEQQAVDDFLSVGEREIAQVDDRIDLATTAVIVQMMFAFDETIMKR